MNSKISEIWIDALEFEKGGWKEDTQFVHLMGSGFLLAADKPGIPVNDAHISVNIPSEGVYRFWVRDRNWLRPHNPGTFNLLVNGENNGTVLGKQPSDAWVWEIAGDYTLKEGLCTITLHDLTGYFARCASIIITNNFDYVPPREVERIHKERARMKNIDYTTSFDGEYDVIVAGGGPGGVPAALACARLGAKTLLIQNRSMLGGNSSPEIGVTFDGAEVSHPRAREGGIAEEIRRLRDREEESIGDWTKAMEKLTEAEPNLTVICNSHVCDAEVENCDTIKGVTVLNTYTLLKSRYIAKLYIDCTGDAWLGYYAGAYYRYGREASYQHNEDIAPKIPDTQTMSGCVRCRPLQYFFESKEDVEYHAPQWVPKLPEDEAEFGRVIEEPRMYWWLEAPNTYDDMWDAEEARDALLMVILGYYDHLKNHWSGRDKYKKTEFRFSTIINGRRESRRLIGDYILTQDDCVEGRAFDDAISYSGWPIDIHHPDGIYSGRLGPLYCGRRVNLPKIPYRCLYSKNIKNLFFAGRNISVTHIALGTVRVQNTIATLGQAVGTAAAMCIKLNETPRGIYERHMKCLQQILIKNDQFIPGLKNEDSGDPCLTAEVTASSISTTEIFTPSFGVIGKLYPLDVPRSTVRGISVVNRGFNGVNGIYLRLHSSLPDAHIMHIYARILGDLDTISDLQDTYSAEAEVPPNLENWVFFPLIIPIDPKQVPNGAYIQLWTETEEGISWRSIDKLSNYRKIGIKDADGNWQWKYGRELSFKLSKPQNDILANCAPENVINGHSRIISEKDYEWVSNPKECLPQWIKLKFAHPTKINSVSIVFDTDMTNPGTCFNVKYPTVATCVKSYKVEVFDGTTWIKVVDVTDNFMRKRTHKFATMLSQMIRITVYETWGDPSARITEVRASLEEE